MDIPYARRSKFLKPCNQVLTAHHETLGSGSVLNVALGPGGYSGRLIVTIPPGVATTFQAEWGAKDITRFPSRIKAAATALRDCGIIGSFEISHDDGALSIFRVMHERPNE